MHIKLYKFLQSCWRIETMCYPLTCVHRELSLLLWCSELAKIYDEVHLPIVGITYGEWDSCQRKKVKKKEFASTSLCVCESSANYYNKSLSFSTLFARVIYFVWLTPVLHPFASPSFHSAYAKSKNVSSVDKWRNTFWILFVRRLINNRKRCFLFIMCLNILVWYY